MPCKCIGAALAVIGRVVCAFHRVVWIAKRAAGSQSIVLLEVVGCKRPWRLERLQAFTLGLPVPNTEIQGNSSWSQRSSKESSHFLMRGKRTLHDMERSCKLEHRAAMHFQSLPVLKNLLLCHECMAYWFYDLTGSSVDQLKWKLQQSLKTTPVYYFTGDVSQRCWKLWTNNFKHIQTYWKTLKASTKRSHAAFSFPNCMRWLSFSPRHGVRATEGKLEIQSFGCH